MNRAWMPGNLGRKVPRDESANHNLIWLAIWLAGWLATWLPVWLLYR